MKRASYREAIRWMVYNDDTSWIDNEYISASITAYLVADLFDVPIEKVIKDLKRYDQR